MDTARIIEEAAENKKTINVSVMRGIVEYDSGNIKAQEYHKEDVCNEWGNIGEGWE